MSESSKEDSDQEPKIIVDTDWKDQVAKEKQAAEGETASGEAGDVPAEANDISAEADDVPAEADDATPTESAGEHDASELPPPPPASFEMLVSMLFTQAMAALGQVPDPSGNASINKPYAKHYIDTLEMLSEKTNGNLSEAESKMVDEALHALRMTYVNTRE